MELMNTVIAYNNEVNKRESSVFGSLSSLNRAGKIPEYMLKKISDMCKKLHNFPELPVPLTHFSKYFTVIGLHKYDIFDLVALVKGLSSQTLPLFAMRDISRQNPKFEEYERLASLVLNDELDDEYHYVKRYSGQHRRVFLIDDLAIKLSKSVLGQQPREQALWFNMPDKKLCPIAYVSSDMSVTIMMRSEDISNTLEVEQFYGIPDVSDGVYLDSYAKVWEIGPTGEWGKYNGRYVIRDYGANDFPNALIYPDISKERALKDLSERTVERAISSDIEKLD